MSFEDVEERFWNFTDLPNERGCWEWIGGKRRDGSGQFSFQGRNILAHRFAYMISPYRKEEHFDEDGMILEDIDVVHKEGCDRSCVRFDHLFAGTWEEVGPEIAKRKRNILERSKVKLSREDYEEIYTQYKRGKSLYDLADEYDRSRGGIKYIIRQVEKERKK